MVIDEKQQQQNFQQPVQPPNGEQNRDVKKIVTFGILIVTLMISITGATYAYFAFSATDTNTITGTAATASLSFSVSPTLIAPSVTAYKTKPLVPQISLSGTTNVLQKAFNGSSTATGYCVDANGNAICRAYTFTIKNDSTATAVIKGQIKFTYGTSSSFANLKWKLMDSATAVTVSSSAGGTLASTSTWQTFATNVSLVPNATKQYWIIMWIEETGSSQNSTDYGTFYSTIQFINNVDGSGLTSTITS